MSEPKMFSIVQVESAISGATRSPGSSESDSRSWSTTSSTPAALKTGGMTMGTPAVWAADAEPAEMPMFDSPWIGPLNSAEYGTAAAGAAASARTPTAAAASRQGWNQRDDAEELMPLELRARPKKW